MANSFLIQLIGLVLALAGLIALTASTHLFGSLLTPAEKKRASDEWNRQKNADARRLPISPETIISSIFFLGGVAILIWSKFDHCAFLAYWLPSLPEVTRQVLSCL